MARQSFLNDLYYEDIHFRDSLQFELQADFSPMAEEKESRSVQEFYIYIPSSLQVNASTYSKEQFYKDCTNLIRFKTPEFTFKQLIDEKNTRSPLQRIDALEHLKLEPDILQMITDELKLLANIARSTLRISLRNFLEEMKESQSKKTIASILEFIDDLKAFRLLFFEIEKKHLARWPKGQVSSFWHVDEFISRSIDFYLTGFLQTIKDRYLKETNAIQEELVMFIEKEKKRRCTFFDEPQSIAAASYGQKEEFQIHKSVLNKYVANALLLNVERKAASEKFSNIFASIAAAVAMLVYVFLVFLNVPYFGLNSLSFLLLTVVLYVLKDRVKDGLKVIFQKRAVKWFSDLTTSIYHTDKKKPMGKLREFFSFVDEKNVPEDIQKTRSSAFESDLPHFMQPESVLYYKKEMTVSNVTGPRKARRHKIHNVFLFNVHLLIEKASDPIEKVFDLDTETKEVKEFALPKVYHLNIIMKVQEANKKQVKIKKFCVVVDKNGIKRVENL